MSTQKKFKLVKAQKQDVKVANAFYKQQRFKGKARKGEWLAQTLQDNELMALLRLTTIEDEILMRNFCVHAEHRNCGLGSWTLSQTRAQIQHSVYTFPLANLVDWYQKNGASIIPAENLPASLLPYYRRYCENDPGLKCAVFSASS